MPYRLPQEKEVAQMIKTYRLASWLALLAAPLSTSVIAGKLEEQLKRGEYAFALGGCASCHTDSKNKGAPLAGGLKMETPFGIFYTPNISSDKLRGIGSWSNQDFLNAMRRGISPTGEHYYPAFPYTSYSKMSEEELLDMKAYLDAQPPAKESSRAHQLSFPFNQRALLGFWKWMNFDGAEFTPDPDRSDSWNRGAYLVNGPSHCVECHTPRNLLGGLDVASGMIGNEEGPDGESVPGLDKTVNPGFAKWQIADIVFSLETGMKLDGDFVGGAMGHVIDNTTSLMTEADRQAIAEYLQSPRN